METKANYVAVGIFTLVAILAAFGFVYWATNLGGRGDAVLVEFRIKGSAYGVVRGASLVTLNGVKIGEVFDLTLALDDPKQPGIAVAKAYIDPKTPLTYPSTTAKIGIVLLGGAANIEMMGGNPAEPTVFELARQTTNGRVTIETEPAASLPDLADRAQSVIARVDTLLEQVEGLAGDARVPLTETLRNVERFSQALSDNSDGVGKFLESVSALSTTLSGASGQIEASLAGLDRLIAAVDPEKISSTVDNVERFTQRLDDASGGLDQIMAGVGTTVESLTQFSDAANRTLARIDEVVEGVDPAAVRDMVANFRQASDNVGAAADQVATLVASVNARSADIDGIITDARTLAGRLNGAAERVDAVLGRVDGLLGSEDAQKVIGEANRTLASIRESATTLTARVDGVLTRVDGLIGSEDAQNVIGEANRTLQSFRETAQSLDRRVDEIARELLGSGEAGGVIAEANETIKAYREVADTLNQRIDTILGRVDRLLESGDVEQVVAEAGDTLKAFREVADTLNARMGGVLDKVEGLLGSEEAEGVMAEASETLKSFRQVADTLNARIGPITDGLSRFSGQGLRDVEALVQDGRRAITRIEQAISSLERNPQRILSGGAGTVREYDGRARR